MNNVFGAYWGIDVSKNWLDISSGEKVIRIKQNQQDIRAFITTHKEKDQEILAVLESTGGYEQLAIQCLSEENIAVHRAHPNRVKAFAKAKGRLAKSDKIDAKILKEYGAFINPKEIRALLTPIQNKLQRLGSRLEQLKEMHHQESCRLGMAIDEGIKESLEEVLALLKRQMEQTQEAILDVIKLNDELKEKYELLRSMKGVGPMLAMKLITDLPELGNASKKEIAALVGVAPITHESGQKTGKATTKYGRFSVRKVLYMGALSASRFNPKLRAFYDKLIAAGKAPKVALVAVMRKMIVILNVMVQSKTPFYA